MNYLPTILLMNFILAFILVFFQRKNPKSVWAWLFVIGFLPGIGLILYLIVCQNFHKKKMFSHKALEDAIQTQTLYQEKQLSQNRFFSKESSYRKYEQLLHYNLTSHAPFRFCQEIEIYHHGPDKFKALQEELKKAKKFIHIQYYILRYDEAFSPIQEILKQKVKEGVEVRILYDGMGGIGIRRKDRLAMQNMGFQVAVFFPTVLKALTIRINYRNHRKIVVIDGETAFIGGFNIGREYLGLSKKYGYWRDTHLKITGDGVQDLQIRFLLDWSYATKEPFLEAEWYFPVYRIPKNPIGIQILSNGPDTRYPTLLDNFLRLIYSAKKHIYIQTPYFIPDDSLFYALRIAALSNVKVILMIPCKPDHAFVYWATHSYAGDLLESGVKCYLYEKGFLHAKGIMIDGYISSYGTANLDSRSFLLNFETNVMIYHEETTKRLEQIFERDLENSRELTLEDYKKRALSIRIREQIGRLLSPLL